jgi:hypothetical protein
MKVILLAQLGAQKTNRHFLLHRPLKVELFAYVTLLCQLHRADVGNKYLTLVCRGNNYKIIGVLEYLDHFLALEMFRSKYGSYTVL